MVGIDELQSWIGRRNSDGMADGIEMEWTGVTTQGRRLGFNFDVAPLLQEQCVFYFRGNRQDE